MPQNKLLEAAIKVRKIELGRVDAEHFGKRLRTTHQRQSANFEEFKKVYGRLETGNVQVEKAAPLSQPANSKSCFKTLRAKKDPKHVKFVEIEVPASLGSENAILPIGKAHATQNKEVKTVNRESLTDNLATRAWPSKTTDDSVTLKQVNDVAVYVPNRRQKFLKNVAKWTTRTAKRKDEHLKIASALSKINDKLQKILVVDESPPKTNTPSKYDCFTQSCNVEVLFQNQHYPDDPKIDDTLKEIEAHLDNIANLDFENCTQKTGDDNKIVSRKPVNVRSPFGFEYPRESSATERFLRNGREAKCDKLTAIRQQIATIEEFFERIERLDKIDGESSSECAIKQQTEQEELSRQPNEELVSPTDLAKAIQKSSFLSKEFNANCKVKVFSDSEKNFLRERRGFLRRNGDRYRSEGSISKLIENVRTSLENTLYEPAS